MASGRHLLAELDTALHTSRDEFRALDIELQASSAALARNQRRQISVYQRLARERLAELVRKALVAPKKRIKTRPTLGSKKRRLKAKKVRGEVKALRGKVDPEG